MHSQNSAHEVSVRDCKVLDIHKSRRWSICLGESKLSKGRIRELEKMCITEE